MPRAIDSEHQPTTEEPVSDIDERIAAAPLPTERTLRMRASVPVQAWRFARINLRMVRMIRRGHAPLSSQHPTSRVR
jgi:hypothetical protein